MARREWRAEGTGDVSAEPGPGRLPRPSTALRRGIALPSQPNEAADGLEEGVQGRGTDAASEASDRSRRSRGGTGRLGALAPAAEAVAGAADSRADSRWPLVRGLSLDSAWGEVGAAAPPAE